MDIDSNLEPIDETCKNSLKKERPSDIRKKVKYFEESRDEWKERNAQKRVKIQTLMTKNNRLENALEAHNKALSDLEEKLDVAERLIKNLEKENKKKDEEIESLKKKLK